VERALAIIMGVGDPSSKIKSTSNPFIYVETKRCGRGRMK